MTSEPEIPASVDLDMLAYDIADTLDRGEHGMDEITQDEIRRALPDFLRACLADAAAGRDPYVDVQLRQVTDLVVGRGAVLCSAQFGNGWYCTREEHPERWQHIATTPGGEVVALGIGDQCTAEVTKLVSWECSVCRDPQRGERLVCARCGTGRPSGGGQR